MGSGDALEEASGRRTAHPLRRQRKRVTAAYIKGSSDSPEVTHMGGSILVFASKEPSSPMFYKIVSKDHTADGPTRPYEVGCS